MHKWLFEIGKFKVPMYGLMIAIGIIVCFAILRYGCKKKNIPSRLSLWYAQPAEKLLLAHSI